MKSNGKIIMKIWLMAFANMVLLFIIGLSSMMKAIFAQMLEIYSLNMNTNKIARLQWQKCKVVFMTKEALGFIIGLVIYTIKTIGKW